MTERKHVLLTTEAEGRVLLCLSSPYAQGGRIWGMNALDKLRNICSMTSVYKWPFTFLARITFWWPRVIRPWRRQASHLLGI